MEPVAASSTPVSVVTVVKDDPAGLRRTLASLASSLPAAEVIVVESASEQSAESRAVEREAKHSLRFLRWVCGPDDGPYDGMNRGIGLASRRWVWFLNAGDTATAGAREVVSSLSRLDAAWVVCSVMTEGADGSPRGLRQAGSVDMSSWRTGSAGSFCHQGVLFDRRRLVELGGYDTSLRISSDYHLMLRFSLIEDPSVIPVPLAVFRYGGLSSRCAGRLQWENTLARRAVLHPARRFVLYDRLRACWRIARSARRS